MFGKFLTLTESRLFSLIGYLAAVVLPRFGKINKYRNILLAAFSINRKHSRPFNNPIRVRIAPSAICNYQCVFCEIHKDNLLYPDRGANFITVDTIANYDSFLSTAYTLAFFGGSAEPLLNNRFADIVQRLKSRYGLRMTVNTNASSLTPQLTDVLVENGFDELLVSYHAGTKEAYKALMSGDIDKVDSNLSYLSAKKAESGKSRPRVTFNYAPQKINAGECRAIVDKAKALSVSAIQVSRYHGGRNLLQGQDVDFYDDPETGNAFLDEMYAYARQQGVTLNPPKPRHFEDRVETQWNPQNYDASIRCLQPWTDLYLEPVLDTPNSHYARVCNRGVMFKIRFDEMDLSRRSGFVQLWNHPMLQYLRETVNAKDINPLCKYCKNLDRQEIRNLDHQRYAKVRDRAMVDFYRAFRDNYPDCKEILGLEVLKGHPFPEKDYIKAQSGNNTKANEG